MLTIVDIARESGVSVTTVSRVINNSDAVRDLTRKKVMDVIDKYNYVPNNIAQSLVRKSTKMVGIIVADINNPYYSEIVRGIEDTTDAYGYTIILCNSDENMDKEKKYIDILLQKQVDAIIFAGGRGSGSKYNEHIEKLSEKVTVVLANEYLKSDNIYCVTCDKKMGAYIVVKHLLSLGHERIGYISGYKDYKPSMEKLEGYKEAILEAGIEYDENLVAYGNYHIDGGHDSIDELIKLTNAPTAIFAANDLMAIGAMKALKERNYKIPRDISIVGFDDIKLNDFVDPTLTSVSQNLYEIGKRSALIINDIFTGSKDIKHKDVLDPILKIRGSSSENAKKI